MEFVSSVADASTLTYPDGRVVRYDRKAMVANVKSPRDVYQSNDQVGIDQFDRPVNARFLWNNANRSMTYEHMVYRLVPLRD